MIPNPMPLKELSYPNSLRPKAKHLLGYTWQPNIQELAASIRPSKRRRLSLPKMPKSSTVQPMLPENKVQG